MGRKGMNGEVSLGKRGMNSVHHDIITPPTGFITQWVVSSTDVDGRVVALPLLGSDFTEALGCPAAVYDFTVDWGDGTPNDTVTAWDDADATHTYSADGTYDVEIRGECNVWDTGDLSLYGTYVDQDKVIKVLSWGDSSLFGGFSYVNFWNCKNLISIATPILSKPNLTSFSNLFSECTLLTAIPTDLFRYCPNVQSFVAAFNNCASITTIPAELFRYNTAAVDFSTVFQHAAISAFPTDLFRYNTAVTSFGAAFEGTLLTTVPVDLFRYNIVVGQFNDTFFGCTLLASIPVDLFRYNTIATNFYDTFFGCTSLTSVPTDLFRYNTLAINFMGTFYECTALQLNDFIFYVEGGETTRFLNQSVNFTSCFSRTTLADTQGTAPDLWNCSFGTGTPTITGCFGGAGNSPTSISNYGDIPVGWK